MPPHPSLSPKQSLGERVLKAGEGELSFILIGALRVVNELARGPCIPARRPKSKRAVHISFWRRRLNNRDPAIQSGCATRYCFARIGPAGRRGARGRRCMLPRFRLRISTWADGAAKITGTFSLTRVLKPAASRWTVSRAAALYVARRDRVHI